MIASVIVETRQISNIGTIVKDHLSKLPENDLFIFHSRDNKRLFQEVKAEYEEVQISSLRDYNTLLTSTLFWDRFLSYDHVVIFQNDSKILKEGIEEFYEWDYVGAPWKFQYHGGNGGFSLRNPKVMYETLARVPYNHSLGYEDVYFCNHMHGNLAPRQVCERFSCETIYKLGTLAYHAIDNYLTKTECNEIRNQYGEK